MDVGRVGAFAGRLVGDDVVDQPADRPAGCLVGAFVLARVGVFLVRDFWDLAWLLASNSTRTADE